ncbi:hypothetical protein [Desulfitobacterium chlororespirans]|uniref:Uncharacterized protein n=1 Tax=Desulfitobacterium chlororespirans DSM 11544 TaxID=1121395 RepID=A0A1M7UFU6_9FIRM|nr:hypothetical protein [Desulfitobacterium chlororespirans]SHN81785.1 hypothetical protein SAMN02745215_03662 [Desulfitobacterium chlororespirans DSM 11544]
MLINILRFLNFLKDPHSQKIQQHKQRYQELDQLLKVAADIQDAAAYKSVEAEMREVFFEYLTALGIDSLYKFSPHLVLACLISLKFKTITIPLFDWSINTVFAYLGMYFLFHLVLKPLFKLIMSRHAKAARECFQVITEK